jgi:aminoglycoside phosphotransferase (APT) family kinase protein
MKIRDTKADVGLDRARIARFGARLCGRPAHELDVRMAPLRGGLAAPDVARVQVCGAANRVAAQFVVKRVNAKDLREPAAYRMLASAGAPVAPALMGAETVRGCELYMYLEWVAAWKPWPWAQTEVAALVLQQLARVHGLPAAGVPASIAAWNYEADLLQSAEETLLFFEQRLKHQALATARRSLRPVQRIVSDLPAIRRELMGSGQPVLLHGDAHPGNVIIRHHRSAKHAVLLDWGRTRIGSPYEDVCSWLHSLCFWEPEARRRHDTLLRSYLEARGLSTTLVPAVRELCWMAGACNALAGALRYHLYVLTDAPSGSRRQYRAACAVHDWLRVVRRADHCRRN